MTDRFHPTEPDRALPRDAWSGSPGVDAVVTALVLQLPDVQLAPRATIGPIRLRRGTCAVVAVAVGLFRRTGICLSFDSNGVRTC